MKLTDDTENIRLEERRNGKTKDAEELCYDNPVAIETEENELGEEDEGGVREEFDRTTNVLEEADRMQYGMPVTPEVKKKKPKYRNALKMLKPFRGNKLQDLWEDERKKKGSERASFQSTWFRFIRTRFIVALFVSIVSLACQVISAAYIVETILSRLETGQGELWVGLVLAAAMLVSEVIRAVFYAATWLVMYQAGIRIRGAAVTLVYRHLVRLKSLGKKSVGELVNICANDSQRLFEGTAFMTMLMAGPLIFLVVIGYGYYVIGPWSLLGNFIFVLFFPIQMGISKLTTTLRGKLAPVSDKRVKRMNEILSSIKLIKMYAWEQPFGARIKEQRSEERKRIQHVNFVQSLSSTITPIIPILAAVCTFIGHTMTGNDLTATQAFTIINLFTILRNAITIVPSCVRNISEARVSCDRIKSFLALETRNPTKQNPDMGDRAVIVDGASFTWNKPTSQSNVKNGGHANGKSQNGKKEFNGHGNGDISGDVDNDATACAKPTLTCIDLDVSKGELVGICGPVGSGKTSLLSSILGQIEVVPGTGDVRVNGQISYASQSPWIFNASVKDNIIFGSTFDEAWYNKVIYACSLVDDFRILANGDETEIGERGSNLSGGQKQRVNLARAVYSNRDVILLDDPLSAVDVHVGEHIFKHCIQTLLKDKTVILVTHQLQYLDKCTTIIYMEGGEILEQGSHESLVNAGNVYSQMMAKWQPSDNKTADDTSKGEANGVGAKKERNGSGGKPKSKGKGGLVSAEKKKSGSVESKVYVAYIRACGGWCLTILVLLLFVAYIGCTTFSNMFLSYWIRQGSGQIQYTPELIAELERLNFSTPYPVHHEMFRRSVDNMTMNISSTEWPTVTLGSSANSAPIAPTSQGSLTQSVTPSATRGHTTQGTNTQTTSIHEAATHGPTTTQDATTIGQTTLDEVTTQVQTIAHGATTGGQTATLHDVSTHGPTTKAPTTQSITAVDANTTTSFPHTSTSQGITTTTEAPTSQPPTGIQVSTTQEQTTEAQTTQMPVTNTTNTTGPTRPPFSKSITDNPRLHDYVLIYGMTVVAMLVLGVVKGLIYVKTTLRAANTLHKRMFTNIMRSPMSFFDTNPVGRVINRFSKDMDEVDSRLAFFMETFLHQVLLIISAMLIITISFPAFLIAVIPVGIAFVIINIRSIVGIRQLKRLDNISRSPLLSQLTTTVEGLHTIQAFNKEKQMEEKFNQVLDANSVPFFLFNCSMRWFTLRLDIIGVFLTVATAFVVVVTNHFSEIDPALAGLALSYALQLTGYFQFTVRLKSDVEARFTSVERIEEYAETLDSEAADVVVNSRPPANWPTDGRVVFNHHDMRYRENLPLTLKDLDFEACPRQKIGIVGRTGAGKSSICTSLFRLVESAGGTVVIDGIDISQIGLKDLRSRMSVIPQDPVLFAGTLRYNLDPFNWYQDDQIWMALESVYMKDKVKGLPLKLDNEVEENGRNFSLGERQLLCMARVLLRGSKILLLDEATAAIDTQTDAKIQKTIRESFKDCTLLTIAHRLNTILDSDKIILMDDGKILEQGSPKELLADPNSRFSGMTSTNKNTNASQEENEEVENESTEL